MYPKFTLAFILPKLNFKETQELRRIFIVLRKYIFCLVTQGARVFNQEGFYCKDYRLKVWSPLTKKPLKIFKFSKTKVYIVGTNETTQ